MTILYKSILTVAVLGFLIWGLTILPDAENYPYPEGAITGINLIWGYMLAFNIILPVHTFILLVKWGFFIIILTDILWPSFLWVISYVRSLSS